MSDANILKPQDEAGVLEAVQDALASSTPLEIIGHGSKRGIGRRVDAGRVLDVSRLTGVTLYEPDELVLSAKAGTPMVEIEKLLADNNQCFHFEPMDYGPLLSGEGGRGTIGGALAANLSGPRRLKAGAARDHVLGVRVVSGRGELFKSGGRVVKNVTGYDLSKGMANSWGTLGVATEVTFKVLPKPETAATLAVRGLTDEQAARVMAMAMGSREEVASAAHLPPTVANRFLDGKLGWDAATVLRLEGFAPSVEHRSRQLQALLSQSGEVEMLDGQQSHQLWREVRDVLPYANAGDNRAVWRVSITPMQGWRMVDEFRRYAGVDAYYDWQGGLIWMRMEADPEAQTLRKLITKYGGGHATLVRASEHIRASNAVFEPQPAALAALSQRLKQQFDPENILNPGVCIPVRPELEAMQTHFSPDQLRDSGVSEAEKILRKCVHCGFCTATCPTYVTLGNELDSPRGRIYLIKDMLENGRPADEEIVRHVDRCLSCLSCMTTCPSGVNYMHLVDHARAHIEKTYKRPFMNRFLRGVLAQVLPYPGRFRAALKLAKLGKPFAPLLRKSQSLRPMAAMLDLAPQNLPAAANIETVSAAKGEKRGRVAILNGCAQPVLNPGINAATLRLLNRFGIEVVTPKGEGCCGSLVHHMGREEQALEQARHNVDVWTREIEAGGLDAIIVTASGCGTTIKDYGYMLRLDPFYKDKAAHVSALAKDITEYLTGIDLPEPDAPQALTVAYHSACSMQHGQKIVRQPKDLLSKAGFMVKEPLEGHLCCGSAGTYNIMQPEIAAKLRDRKVKNIEATGAALIATGNIGCMTQIATGSRLPIVHTVELIDWAYGGPKPQGLSQIAA